MLEMRMEKRGNNATHTHTRRPTRFTHIATSKLQTLTHNHRYTIPKNYHGLTLKQAAK